MNWALIVQLLPQAFQVILNAAKLVEEATGKTPADAIQEVIDHNTPGAPNSPTLSENKS